MEKREYIEGRLLYIAHPYGGDEKNKERVQTYLKMLQAKYPEKTLRLSSAETGEKAEVVIRNMPLPM